ncbi:MAG: hypothetical protein KF749_14790 [Bacteroidetes bacterium]|nr:hypothetical protein [Bacteroidota bacterium]MCW5894270.1 hypothetical protein [Bacteroidota bacterium]
MTRNHPSHHLLVVFTLAFMTFAVCGCDPDLTGTYTSQGGLVHQTLTFKPGGKLEVRALDLTQEGEYEREGKKVRIRVGGSTTILTIGENGCLDAGTMIGKFCKD